MHTLEKQDYAQRWKDRVERNQRRQAAILAAVGDDPGPACQRLATMTVHSHPWTIEKVIDEATAEIESRQALVAHPDEVRKGVGK